MIIYIKIPNISILFKVNRKKQNGQSVFFPTERCHCVIEKLMVNKERTKIIQRKVAIKAKTAEKYKE